MRKFEFYQKTLNWPFVYEKTFHVSIYIDLKNIKGTLSLEVRRKLKQKIGSLIMPGGCREFFSPTASQF